VLPYYGYSRQDRKSGPRTPISAKLVANLIQTAGADRVLTVDLHADQIQGFFDIPTDNLTAEGIFVQHIEKQYGRGEDLVIVSPDVGGVVRARQIARRLDANLVIIDKRRERAGISEVMNVIGSVSGKKCILVDDIIDSAGTVCNASVALLEAGAYMVACYATHGVLSGGAVSRVISSSLENLVIMDSIRATEAVQEAENIRQVSMASLLGKAIRCVSEERSLSVLLDEHCA
jgi:ribose-phosphate pyrophosphokinase